MSTMTRLQEIRREAGFDSQQSWAVAAGLSVRTVARIEAGALPSRETAQSLARTLGMSVDSLLELLEGAVA